MTPLEESNSQGFVENEDYTGVYLKVQGNQYDGEQPTVSARALHIGLGITERFSAWFNRQLQYGFCENTDYVGCKEFNTLAKQELQDYQISVDMAKQICMIQRSEKGRLYRQYFIDLEKAWNTPEQIMARALKVADKRIESLKQDNVLLAQDVERMRPKEIFADAVAASHTSILIGELAKLLKQSASGQGRNRKDRSMMTKKYIRQAVGDIATNLPPTRIYRT